MIMSKKNKNDYLKEIERCFIDLAAAEKLSELVKISLDRGIQPEQILSTMKNGLDEVGKRYDSGEYFLSDLIMAGIMATDVTNLIKPRISSSTKLRGKVLIGTVEGDIHDIGKNLVINMLSTQGYDVSDLGVNVPPEEFVIKVQQQQPDVLAMSCLLTMGLEKIERTINLIEKNGLSVKIIIGGRCVTEDFAKRLGVEYGEGALKAIKLVSSLMDSD